MTLRVVALIAQQRDSTVELFCEFFQQRGLRSQVAVEIAKEARIVAVVAQPMTDGRWRAEARFVTVINAHRGQAIPQRSLRETTTT